MSDRGTITGDRGAISAELTCYICQETKVCDGVEMTCTARHKFCFECIVKSVETTKTLMNCPYCRGGNNCIIEYPIKSDIRVVGEPFYTLPYYKRSIDLLYGIFKLETSQ